MMKALCLLTWQRKKNMPRGKAVNKMGDAHFFHRSCSTPFDGLNQIVIKMLLFLERIVIESFLQPQTGTKQHTCMMENKRSLYENPFHLVLRGLA